MTAQGAEGAKVGARLSIFGASPCGVSRAVLEVELLGPVPAGPALAAVILNAWGFAVRHGCAVLCSCCHPTEWLFTVWLDDERVGAFGGAIRDDSWRWN